MRQETEGEYVTDNTPEWIERALDAAAARYYGDAEGQIADAVKAFVRALPKGVGYMETDTQQLRKWAEE